MRGWLLDLIRAHCLDDFCEFVGEISVLLDLVFVEVDRHPHQRASEPVLIEWVEIEIDVAIRIEAAVHASAGSHSAQIIVAHRALPLGAPFGRARRNVGVFNWATARLHLPHIAAANEAERPMVEIVAIEFVDAHANRAGGDERIEVELVLVEVADGVGDRLMGEIAADDTLIGDRIIRLADARHHEEVNVENGERGQDDEVGRLLPFLAA